MGKSVLVRESYSFSPYLQRASILTLLTLCNPKFISKLCQETTTDCHLSSEAKPGLWRALDFGSVLSRVPRWAGDT